MDYFIRKLSKGNRRREYEDIAVLNYNKKAKLLGSITKEEIQSTVPLPVGVEYHEWLATNTLAFFNHIKLMYESLGDHCNPMACDAVLNYATSFAPSLSNISKKSMKMTEYIDSALLEIQNYVTDETFLPTRYDVPFPKHFFRTVHKVFHIMFHVLMHMYQYHLEDMEGVELLCTANTVLVHFTCFQVQYHLIESFCIDT